MDIANLLITVYSMKQKDAADELADIANQQKANIAKLKELRYVQEKVAEATASGDIDEDEWEDLQELYELNGMDLGDFHANSSDGTLTTEASTEEDDDPDDVTETEAATARTTFESLNTTVQGQIDSVEDDQSVVDLQLQMGVDAYQKATETISNMQKRFYDTARAVTQKFGG